MTIAALIISIIALLLSWRNANAVDALHDAYTTLAADAPEAREDRL